jgi:hypothetical protein
MTLGLEKVVAAGLLSSAYRKRGKKAHSWRHWEH